MNPLNILIFIFYTFCASIVTAATFESSPKHTEIYAMPAVESLFDFQEGSAFTSLSEQKKYLKTNYIAVESLISNGKYIEARNQLEIYLRKNSNDPNIYNLLGRLDSLENKILSAKHNFNQSIKINKKNLLAYQGLAKISLNEQNPSEAKASIDKMLSIDKDYYYSYLIQAEYFHLKKDLSNAEQSLLTAYKKVEGNIDTQVRILSILGKFYASQDNYTKTRLLAKNLYKKHESNLLVLSFYATSLVASKEYKQAEVLLKKIIQLNNKDISHRVLLAKILSSQADNKDEVVNLFDKAFSLNKKNLNILVLKASYFTKLRKYTLALETADQLISLAPDSSDGYQLKGDIYKAAKNNSLAIKMYQSALKNNYNSSAVFTLADLFSREKQYSKAINLLRMQLGRNNNDTIIFFKLALIYKRKEDFSQTETYYKKALKISPNHILSLNNLASLYIQQNNSKALNLAEKAFNQTENSAAIADTYGYAQVLFGQAEKGLKILEDAVKQAPKILDIQLHLAIAYSKLGYINEAIQVLEKITLEKQDYPQKNNAVALLQKLKK